MHVTQNSNVNIQTLIHTYKHIYTHMYIHTCIHTYCMDIKFAKITIEYGTITDMQNIKITYRMYRII